MWLEIGSQQDRFQHYFGCYSPIQVNSSMTPTPLKWTLNRQCFIIVNYADKRNQDAVAIACDQAIYAKAQKIRWEDTKENFRKILVMQMGAFHTSITYYGKYR